MKSMPRGGRGKANPGRSFKSSQRAGGTPGAKNPSSSVRGRTVRAGKGVVPPKAKTPMKTKQPNPKGKRSVKSMPVGFKKPNVGKSPVAGIKDLGVKGKKGGTKMPRKAIVRGGYGAQRPNFGSAVRSRSIRSVG